MRSGRAPAATSISETPGWVSRTEAKGTPAVSTMVGKASTWLTGASTVRPAGTPGPARIIGTRAISSYIVDLPHRPRAPRLSPWSLVYITRVFEDRPASSSARSTLPTFSSR